MKRRCSCQLNCVGQREFNKNRVRSRKNPHKSQASRSPHKRRGPFPGGPPTRSSDGSRQSPITVDQRRCTSAVTLGAAVFARSARVAHDKGAAATTRHARAQPPDRDRKGSPIIIMPSGSHPASPSKRRSRSPAPRFEPEPEPEVAEEAPVELAEAAAPARRPKQL